MNKKIGIYIRKKFHKKRWRQFAFMMACIVVFCTTYALLLPAITLEKTAACGLEEHQHEESCYEDHLVCGQEESGGHRHSDICYRKVLACGKEVHVHSADCFQDKVLEGTMDGGFRIDDTGEETRTSLLEEAENTGDTAVNEQAADSALDLEAEEIEETAGEAQTLSEETAVGEVESGEEDSAEEVGSDEKNSAEEVDAAENQFSEEEGFKDGEYFEKGENLTEEAEETVGEETGSVEEDSAGETGLVEDNPAGETGSVEEYSAGEAETTQEQSFAEDEAGEAETTQEQFFAEDDAGEAETTQEQSFAEDDSGETETPPEKTIGETFGENAGATTEQTAPDEMTEAEAAPAQGVAADLACQGQDYEVTVSAEEEAGIPEGASLSVSEIMPETSADNTDTDDNTDSTDDNTDTELTYEEYISRTEEALGLKEASDFNIRLFDIKIVDAYGEKIRIQTPVDVKIRLTDREDGYVSNAQIVHFADETNETDTAEGTNDREKTDSEAFSESAAKSAATPSRNAEATGKAKKIKKAAKAKKEKEGLVIQDVTVDTGMLPEDGTTLSFVTEGFSVFAVVRTTIEKTVLASDGKNYKVTVTYGAETGIPVDADLAVEEILPYKNDDASISSDYEEYVLKTENALGWEAGSASYARVFDIKIVDKNDHSVKYQPKEDTVVDVWIELADKDSGEEAVANTQVVHFEDDSEGCEIVEAETDGQTVSFKASGFSIYAIVDDTKIITVNFYDGDGNFISSEYVKKNGDEIEDLFSPGFELEYGERFYGWATSQDAVSGIDIDALNASFKANWSSYSEDTPVNYYAVVKKVYVVTFNKYDAEGNLVVLRTVTIPVDQYNKIITIPGDLGAEVGNDFQGWLGQDGTLYTEGTSFAVNDHCSFFMKERGRNWLVFDSNAGGPGSGATYTPPQLIYGEGVVTEQPGNPTRTGYSFLGWNTSPDGSGTWWFKTDGSVTNRFGGTISSDTTLYAQWEGDLTKYYVLYWQQDVTDTAGLSNDQKHYTYVGSREVTTARTGDTVSTIASDRNKDGSTGYEQYHYNDAKSQTTATVAADGTTTLNVYYDLNQYTLSFQIYDYTYTPTTSNNGTQYGLYNGEYVRIYYNNGIWYRTRTGGGYSYSNPYTGIRYTRSYYQSWQTIKTINALYGHNISDQFPIVGTNGVTYDNGERWEPQYNNVGFNEVMVYLDVMPGGDVTFHLNESSYTTKHMHYYVEALPGQTATRTYNGRGFIEYTSFDANYNFFTEAEDYVDLVGFTKNTAFPPEGYNNNNVKLNTVWRNPNAINVFCYYLRDQKKIHYVSVNDGRQEFDESVYYEEVLSSYSNVIPTNGMEGYAFVGWYTDESCAPGTEFDFNSTMPAKDITLYAKWEEQRCRVVLDPNAPIGEYSFANNQTLSFRIDYNEKVDGTNITGTAVSRPGFKLDGWYTEEGNLWNFETQVNESVNGVNTEYQSTADWENNVYGDNDGEHNNIKNILKLKAKWKLDIADNSVYVIYKVNDVYYTYNANGDLQTVIPVDDTAYVLQEGATNISFQTQPAPTGYNDGYVFRDWALLTSSGEKSGTTFMDGSQATVDDEYFVTDTIVDDDGNTGTLRYVVLEAQFDPNENRATAVVYNGNGGTTEAGSTTIGESYLVNKTFTILDGSVFEREGYSFVEWNTKADGTGTSLETGAEVAADNLEGTAWDSVGRTNNLFAIWEVNTYTVTVNKVVYGETATDKEFAFTASASGDYTIPDRDASFTLVNGDEKAFAEVPYGTVLTFIETPTSGFAIKSVDAKQTTKPDNTSLAESSYINLGGDDGKPYTIKGDTIITYTNEKVKEQKLKIRKIGDDALNGLAGAIFSLTAKAGTTIEGFEDLPEITSLGGDPDEENLGYLPGNDLTDVTLFTLPAGDYTLTETTAPENYEGLTESVGLVVTETGISLEKSSADMGLVSITLPENEGDPYLLTIKNMPMAKITVNKVWSSGEFVTTHGSIHTALYKETDGTLSLVDNSVKEITATSNSAVYWVPKADLASYVVREVTVDGDTGDGDDINVTAVDPTGKISVSGETTLIGDNEEDSYIVTYDVGTVQETGTGSLKQRTDTITNTMPTLTINKTDLDGHQLRNAVFTLLKEDKETSVTGFDRITSSDVSSGNLLNEIYLSNGVYYLKETNPPAGYISLEYMLKIVVDQNTIMMLTDTEYAPRDYSDETPDNNLQYTFSIANNPGVALPSTGGPGTRLIYLLGIMLAGLAGIGLVMRKRRKEA